MAPLPLAPDDPRAVLKLARGDRRAAVDALRSTPVQDQVALVCNAPLDARGELLGLLPEPERVIPLLPEAELCFTVKAIGLADSAWVLEHATPEQVTAAIDLDAWASFEPDLPALSDWVGALASTERASFRRAVEALDPELLVLHLKSRVEVFQKAAGDDDWMAPEGAQTLEGQFYYRARNDGDDLASISELLRMLFEEDYWTYFRVMQGAMWELESDTQEWALRWRTGRLEDLGFPSWDESMRIYRFIRPEDRARMPDDEPPLAGVEWSLPVWIPSLPAAAGREHRIFDAIARLTEDERRACFYAFVAVANKIAVADSMPLSDATSIPRAIDKAARWISEGLAHVARENGLDDVAVLRRVGLDWLFSVGANLDPEHARS
ncbi:MAG TPA: DUF6178 family protein [Myxococcota bacterium]|nr:DUF6178 family protein [Myxococcota bacterium]